MTYLKLGEIETKVKDLGRTIGAPQQFLPTFGFSNDIGHPHVEVSRDGYHYVVVERGTEFKRESSKNLFDLLYWIFEGITFSMAMQFELENRVSNQDPRVLIFKKQLELISKIDDEFGKRLGRELNNAIKNNPITE